MMYGKTEKYYKIIKESQTCSNGSQQKWSDVE